MHSHRGQLPAGKARMPTLAQLLDKRTLGELGRFACVGILNTIVGFGVIVLVLTKTELGPFAANLSGYCVAGTVSFYLNRSFTFRADRSHWPVGSFLLAMVAAWCVNAVVLAVALRIVANPIMAQAPAFIAYTGTFFVLSKFVVFRRSVVGS